VNITKSNLAKEVERLQGELQCVKLGYTLARLKLS
jgi:hypothetical protein